MPQIIASKNLMGSPFVLKSYTSSEQSEVQISEAFKAAFKEIERIENLLTDFRPSPFDEINKYAGVKAVQVSGEIFSLIVASQRLSEETKGAFDISYASVGNIMRKYFSAGCIDVSKVALINEQIERMKKHVNYSKIVLDKTHSNVFLPEKQMRIGFGGVGKGYAVDMAFGILRNFGLHNFCINGAGDLRVHSSTKELPPWNIGIKNPFSEKKNMIGVIPLRQGSIATSGDYERYVMFKNKKLHHILDARVCEPRDDLVSVTLVAGTTMHADLYATAVMALGLEEGLALLERHSEIAGFVIDKNGLVHKTQNFSSSCVGEVS